MLMGFQIIPNIVTKRHIWNSNISPNKVPISILRCLSFTFTKDVKFDLWWCLDSGLPLLWDHIFFYESKSKVWKCWSDNQLLSTMVSATSTSYLYLFMTSLLIHYLQQKTETCLRFIVYNMYIYVLEISTTLLPIPIFILHKK